MAETDEIPAELTFQDRGETAGYDCWTITTEDGFVGYLYVDKKTQLIPTRLEFEDELVVHQDY